MDIMSEQKRSKEMNPTQCKHPLPSIVQEWKGRVWFYAGDIYDNLKPYYRCLDCNQTFTEQELEQMEKELLNDSARN
jgi:hypothetical protein